MNKKILVNKLPEKYDRWTTVEFYYEENPSYIYYCNVDEWKMYELKYKIWKEYLVPENLLEEILDIQYKIASRDKDDQAGEDL